MNKRTAMKSEDLSRLLEMIDMHFKEYTYSEIGMSIFTALLYYEHTRVQDIPNADYVAHMEKVTSAIFSSLMASLAATILQNIPNETVN